MVGTRHAQRAALERSHGSGRYTTTIHFIGSQTVDIDAADPDRATGRTYFRGEFEFPRHWVVGTFVADDCFERRVGSWLFVSRRIGACYLVDVLERPNGPNRVKRPITSDGRFDRPTQPEEWSTWGAFGATRTPRDPAPGSSTKAES
jgi:SnoaL-like domain